MFWEMYQQARIHQAENDANTAVRSSERVGQEVHTLQRDIAVLSQQIDRLNLLAIAMAEILRDRFGVTDQEIEAKLREVDLRDGTLDGRIGQPRQTPRPCPACSRTNAANRSACLYCGAPLPVGSLYP